ncbi:unnamed protein product [Oreochromis niloticus]|nr:unnamed protein product [Mustela putorius furo]
MKASVNRVGDDVRYTFDRLMSLFGKNLEKNIVVLITHSAGRKPQNVFEALEAVKIKCARNERNEPVYFLFDNCQHEERTKDEEEELEHAAKISEGGMKGFTHFLEITADNKMMDSVDVMKERITLKACLQNLLERIDHIEGKQKEIKKLQEALDKYKKDMEKNEKFTVEINEEYITTEDIARKGLVYDGALCCTECKENCHFRCTLAPIPQQCGVIKKSFCTVCTNKCHVSKHVKVKWRYVKKNRTVTKTIEQKKLQYEMNKTKC